MGKVTAQLLGYEQTLGPIFVSASIIALICAIYVSSGGQAAVILSDVIQGVLLLGAGLWLFALGISYSAFVSLLIPPFVTETSPIGWVSVGLWRRQITKGQLPVPSILLSSDEGDAP